MTRLNPYISFRGTAREAMEFYQSVFGGELDLSTFSDFQMPGSARTRPNLIMHGQLEAPGGMTLMGADTPRSMELPRAATSPSRSAATTMPSCGATGTSSPRAAP
jgi:PhnB protein